MSCRAGGGGARLSLWIISCVLLDGDAEVERREAGVLELKGEEVECDLVPDARVAALAALSS